MIPIVLFVVPQGSILGPLLFNIFLSVLFLIVKDVNIASYTDDNTLYDSCDTIEQVLLSLQSSSKKPFQWLSDNQMKSKTEKCHLIISTDQNLATDFYKIKNGISPELFTEIFARETESHYNLRWCSDFRIPNYSK